MRGMVALMVAVGLLAPSEVVAGGDNRPQDRFAFGLSVSTATSATAMGVGAPVEVSGFGWETSYWPNDYLGLAYDFSVLAIPSSEGVMASTNTGLGASMVVAVPLRYVQPYAGAWGGGRYNFVASDSRGANLTWAPRVGMNVYVNRNLRVFSQWESLSLEDDSDARGNVLMVGARWSPDVFHRQRGGTKFSAVWGFAAMSVGLWACTSILVGGEAP